MCDLYQRVKITNKNMERSYHMVESSKPGDLVCVDFFGPLPRLVGGVEYIFIVMDAFSKYVRLFANKRETTDIILRKLTGTCFPEMGIPNRMLSDNGTQFSSPKWAEKLRELRINVIFSSVRHPQGNPVERVMREIGRLFRTLCSDQHTRCAKYIPDLKFFLNATTHSSTGFSLVELHFGKKPKDQIIQIISFPETVELSNDAMIVLAKDRMKRKFEQRCKYQKGYSQVCLKEGDLVLFANTKTIGCNKEVDTKIFSYILWPIFD